MKNPYDSNAASYFVTGNKKKEYTYEPGGKLFKVVIVDGGTIPLSVMVFADSVEHATEIVKGLVDFKVQCAREYSAYASSSHDTERASSASVWAELRRDQVLKAMGNINPEKEAEDRRRESAAYIWEPSRGQMYKTGWACNDIL